MSAVRCYAMWRLKDGVEIAKENLSYFSPGGFKFIHKSGNQVCFDFEESYTNYTVEDRLIDSILQEIDNDFITSCLGEDSLDELIEEQYDINFFRNGKIELSDDLYEIYCCLDVIENGELKSEVDFKDYIEPVYLAVFDPYSEDGNCIELYNKLTKNEYEKYFK